MSYSAVLIFTNVCMSLLLCYTIYRDHDIHLARVFGSTLSLIISGVYLLIVSKTRITVRKINIHYAFLWGLPLLFHTVATVVLTQSDRILIKYMDSYSSAGIYTVATTIIAIPLILQQSFNQAWTPWFYGKLATKDYKQIRWLNDRYIILYGVIIASFMLLAQDIVHIFTDEKYWDCVFSLIPLTIGVLAELLCSIPTSVEYYYKKTNFIMIATLITVVINILMDYFFIRVLGYHGAAYATALSKVVLFWIHNRFAKRLNQNSMFSKKVSTFCLCALVALDVLTIVTMNMFFVRYVLLVTILIPSVWYVIKNKNLLLAKMKE